MANTSLEDFEKRQNKKAAGFRSVLDYIISVVFVIIGIICIVRLKPDVTAVGFGVIAILYGIWRGVKGYMKSRPK